MHNTDMQIATSYNVNDSAIRSAGIQRSQGKNQKGNNVSDSAIQDAGTRQCCSSV